MISDIFQLSGTTPVFIERLNRVHSIGEVVAAVSFSILTGMPSKPDALLISRDRMISKTSSSEHNRFSGHSLGSTEIISSAVREGI